MLLGAGLLAGCADLERGEQMEEPTHDAGTSTGDGGDGAVPSFAATIHPLLVKDCRGCHRTGGEAGRGWLLRGEPAEDLPGTRDMVDTSQPAESRLLRKAAGRGHGGGTIHREDSPEYKTILAWIAGGAPP
jgi:hypothetical protein